MEKNILAVAVSLALVGSVAAAEGNPVVITSDNSTYTQAKDAVAHTAFQDQSIQGATGAETLTIEGSYTEGIYAATTNVTLKQLSGLSLHIKEIEDKEEGINGLHAANGHTLKVNVGTLSLAASGEQTKPKTQAPVLIHAYGGNVELDVRGNVTMEADSGNAIMVQHTNSGDTTHEANLTMKAGGDIDIRTGNATSIMVATLQDNTEGGSAKGARLQMSGRNISIHSQGQVGLYVSNNDSNWGSGRGPSNAQLQAQEEMSIYGGFFGMYSNSPKAETTLEAGHALSVEGGSSAVFVS